MKLKTRFAGVLAGLFTLCTAPILTGCGVFDAVVDKALENAEANTDAIKECEELSKSVDKLTDTIDEMVQSIEAGKAVLVEKATIPHKAELPLEEQKIYYFVGCTFEGDFTVSTKEAKVRLFDCTFEYLTKTAVEEKGIKDLLFWKCELISEELTLKDPQVVEGEKVTLKDVRISVMEATQKAAVFAVGAGTEVTIESGNFDGGTLKNDAPAVWAKDGAKVVINGGTFVADEGNSVVYAMNNSIVEINGGVFTSKGPWTNGIYYTLNLKDGSGAKIVVKGGTFLNFDPSKSSTEETPVSFVAEGYKVVLEEKENGDKWYTVVKDEPVKEEVKEETSTDTVEQK